MVNQENHIENHIFHLIKSNDKEAFNALFNDYYQKLCDFSYMIIKRKDLAEEVVADVFSNLWIKRERIEIKSSLKAYLYKSTKNMTISYIRKRNLEHENLEYVILEKAADGPNPEQTIIQKENIEAVHNILSVIPGKSRVVFKMHRIDNLKYREIAEILEISNKSVEKHMGKAIKIMSEYKEKMVI